MEKDKKKLTLKQKEEIKAKIKKCSLTTLHIISYICTALFAIVCIVACLQGCNNKPTKKQSNNANGLQRNNAVNTSEPVKYEDLDRYFYPNDVNMIDWHILHLNFSNYNYLEYFLPNEEKLYNFAPSLALLEVGESESTYLEVEYYNDNGEWAPAPLNAEMRIYYLKGDNGVSYDFGFVYALGNLTRSAPIYSFLEHTLTINDNNNFLNKGGADLIDLVFLSNRFRVKYARGNEEMAKFIFYYLSANSFDYNGYIFAGPEKYVSFMNMFRRVYNGFFIYYPNHEELRITHTIFSGVWEYNLTIYNRIEITLQRAWNGHISYQYQGTTYDIPYGVLYSGSNLPEDIFSGINQGLVNYYFIYNISMVSVNGERTTLAYNRVNNNVVYNGTGQPSRYDTGVYPSNNLKLWNDDSFLNNRNIKFVLYSIDYDYYFNLDSNLFVIYKYYSDFFFNAFYYTGLYHTTIPTIEDDTISVLVPVLSMLAMALTGILPVLNVMILPGVSLGTLLALPFIVTIILFVVKLFKR